MSWGIAWRKRKSGSRQVGTAEGLLFGAAWNIAGLAFVLVSNLMTVPIAIKAIGTAGFGQAVFLLALGSPLMLVGTILGQAVATLGAARVGRGDHEQFYRIFASALLLCLIGVFIIGPLLALVIAAVTSARSGTTILLSNAVLVTVVGLGLRQFGLLFQGALAARKDFRRISMIVVASALIEFALVLMATMLAPSVLGYLSALAISALLSLCCWLLAMRSDIVNMVREYFGSAQSLVHNLVAEFRELFAFTKWQSASATAGIVVNQSNPLLLGFLSSSIVLAQFNVAARLEQAVTAAFGKLSEVLLPHFGQMAGGSSDRLGRHFVVASFTMSCVSAALMGPMIAWSQPILSLWISPEFGEAGAMQLRLLATWGLINMTGSVFTMYALGTGRVAQAARIVLQYAVLAVVLSVAMIMIAGPAFASVGLVLASIFNAWRRWKVGREFIQGPSQLGSAILTLAPAAVAIIFGYVLANWAVLIPESWFGLLWRYAATSAAILLATIMTVSLTGAGRNVQMEILYLLKKIINKF